MKNSNMSPSLTPKQQAVFEFIKDYILENGLAPSFAEVQMNLGASSINSAKQYIDQLIEKGYLVEPKEKHQKRSIQVSPHFLPSEEKSNTVRIQLAGTVAAGYPIEAIETRDYVEVPKPLIKRDAEYFALRVKGDSMIEDCIMEGDLVVIKRQSSASNGQTVVAIVDNEATIKRYYKRKSEIELHPANPNYKVIKVKEDAEFKILGILTSVIRQLE